MQEGRHADLLDLGFGKAEVDGLRHDDDADVQGMGHRVVVVRLEAHQLVDEHPLLAQPPHHGVDKIASLGNPYPRPRDTPPGKRHQKALEDVRGTQEDVRPHDRRQSGRKILPFRDLVDPSVADVLPAQLRGAFPAAADQVDETLQLAERDPLAERDLLDSLFLHLSNQLVQGGGKPKERELVHYRVIAHEADVQGRKPPRLFVDPLVETHKEILHALMAFRIDGHGLDRQGKVGYDREEILVFHRPSVDFRRAAQWLRTAARRDSLPRCR